MPMKKWADWEVFAPVARKVVIDFIAAHPKHRPPKMRELTTPTQRWFYATSRRHGGLRATLIRLGFSLPRREDKPTRRSDWARFSVDARPIIAEYLAKNHHLPTQKELRQGGHVWIDRAIETHHGGYEATYRRLGFVITKERPLSHWPTFVGKFRPAIDGLAQQLERTPSYPEMVEAGHKLLVDAAYRSHGGYRAVLAKLGYTLPRSGKRKGTGFADWEAYEKAFRPIIASFVALHHRPPSLSELKKRRQQKFYFAARNHHGGYLCALQRLGYTPTPQQSVKPRQGWRHRGRQRRALEEHFPELLSFGIMPSSTMVKHALPGLSAYLTWRRLRWADTAAALHLVPYAIGRPQLRRFELLRVATDFYEQEKRWPLRKEIPKHLHPTTPPHIVWEDAFATSTFIPAIQRKLAERLKDHWRWSERHAPHHAHWALQAHNAVILAYNQMHD